MMASDTDKRWKRGYISGSFDMFHIGHLNLIRRAKERCDHLLVGVLTDELVAQKKKWPTIPLNARMEIVAALKYVDEVDVTTQPLLRKVAAWEKYRFDAMFSGDDHAGGGWIREEDKLKELGAELVFFPYTKGVSSTRLQELTLPPKAADADKPRQIGDFQYIFPFDKVNKGERVVIYGAGSVGAQYIRQIRALDFCTVAALADTYAKPDGAVEGMYPVTPEEAVARPDLFDRVVIASAHHHAQMVGKLRVLGVTPERIV